MPRGLPWVATGVPGVGAVPWMGFFEAIKKRTRLGPLDDHPHHMTFCYEPWAVRRFRIVSAKSAPAPCETPPHSGGWPVSVSRRRCRSTRPEDRRRQGQPDPVGGIPSSGSPFRALLLLFPDPLQGLPELNGAGGWGD